MVVIAQKRLTSFFTTSSPNETASDLDHEVPKSLGKTTHLQEEHPESELYASTQQDDLVLDNSTDYTECECPCCQNVGDPYHRFDLSNSTKTQSNQKCGTYSKRTQPGWYSRYPWISVCTTRYKICSMCWHANELKLLIFSKSSHKSTFITDRFSHWSKALKRFDGSTGSSKTA